MKTIFSICWKKWFELKRPLMNLYLLPPWLRNDPIYLFLKLNLESLTVYYGLQLCEGFCCIELVLTEICTLSANVMTTDRCNVNVLSSCFSAYCNALFYCCGISIISLMESIFRVSDNNGPWMSA